MELFSTKTSAVLDDVRLQMHTGQKDPWLANPDFAREERPQLLSEDRAFLDALLCREPLRNLVKTYGDIIACSDDAVREQLLAKACHMMRFDSPLAHHMGGLIAGDGKGSLHLYQMRNVAWKAVIKPSNPNLDSKLCSVDQLFVKFVEAAGRFDSSYRTTDMDPCKKSSLLGEAIQVGSQFYETFESVVSPSVILDYVRPQIAEAELALVTDRRNDDELMMRLSALSEAKDRAITRGGFLASKSLS